jgi:hypothetical protein
MNYKFTAQIFTKFPELDEIRNQVHGLQCKFLPNTGRMKEINSNLWAILDRVCTIENEIVGLGVNNGRSKEHEPEGQSKIESLPEIFFG